MYVYMYVHTVVGFSFVNSGHLLGSFQGITRDRYIHDLESCSLLFFR